MNLEPDLATIDALATRLEDAADQLFSRCRRTSDEVAGSSWRSPAATLLRQVEQANLEQVARARSDLLDAASALRQHGRAAVERSAALRASLAAAESLVTGGARP